MSAKEEIVLVHGAWHAGWCWDKLKPLLEKHGYIVHVLDLPGHGENKCAITEVTLQKYVAYVIEHLPKDKTVHLLGHSLGGIIISQVAEQVPERIKSLIYLSAFLLPNDTSLIEFVQGAEQHPVMNLIFAEDKSTVAIREGDHLKAFYEDCDKELLKIYMPKLHALQPTAPLMQKLQITKERFGSVPKSYIECTKDQAITIERQRIMQKNWKCEKVISLESSHSPFFSQPDKLADAIHSIITTK